MAETVNRNKGPLIFIYLFREVFSRVIMVLLNRMYSSNGSHLKHFNSGYLLRDVIYVNYEFLGF